VTVGELVFEFRPQPWMDQAACTGMYSEVFFPERGQSTVPAKRVCAACPVRQPCLDFALAINERHGIWGGTSERERRLLRRKRGRTRPGPRRRPGRAARVGESTIADGMAV
jgi:WhiB family redox-sensing transcriptional regulator